MQHHRSNAERLDPRRRTRAHMRPRTRTSVVTLALPQLRYVVQSILARIAAR